VTSGHDRDRKLSVFIRAVNSMGELWQPGDAENKDWIWDSLARIEAQFDELPYNTLRARLKTTYLRLKKGDKWLSD